MPATPAGRIWRGAAAVLDNGKLDCTAAAVGGHGSPERMTAGARCQQSWKLGERRALTHEPGQTMRCQRGGGRRMRCGRAVRGFNDSRSALSVELEARREVGSYPRAGAEP